MLADPSVQKLVAEAEEFGFQTGGTSFDVKVVTKMQRDTPGTNVHAFSICSAPPQVSAAQFTANFEAFIDKFLELPAVRKNFVKYTIVSRSGSRRYKLSSSLTVIPTKWTGQGVPVAGSLSSYYTDRGHPR